MGKRKYNPDEIIGQKFGKWTVIEYLGYEKSHMKLKCRCECGKEQNISLSCLIFGSTKQCKSCASKKHGHRYTRLYKIWHNMKQRCYCPSDASYSYYGERGITVCDEWHKFEPFYEWSMNNGYKEDLTIDRIDVNGGYEPNNCKWSTYEEQALNKRILKNNKSGYRGLSLIKRDKKWCAQLALNKKIHHLGSFFTQKEALAVLNGYIIVHNLPHKIQEYHGELVIINDKQIEVQEKWKKEHQ